MFYDATNATLYCSSPDKSNINMFFEDAATVQPQNVNTVVMWTLDRIEGRDKRNVEKIIGYANCWLRFKLSIPYSTNPADAPIQNLVVISAFITDGGILMLKKYAEEHKLSLKIL